jgi:hypothetical protein
MSFVNLPLDKQLNRENILDRLERLEQGGAAKPSARIIQLGQMGEKTGNMIVDGAIEVVNRTDGITDITIDDTGVIIRNQQGAIYFQDTSGNLFNISIGSGGDDFLQLTNYISGAGTRFYCIASGSTDTTSHYFDYDGLHVNGNIFVNADNPLSDGWFPTTDTCTQTGARTFTMPGNRTEDYRKGAKFACLNPTAKYGVIASSSYVDPTTTVTLIANSDYLLTTDTITVPQVAYSEVPLGFPDWFNWSAAPAGFSVAPTAAYRWKTNGNMIFLHYDETADGTSNATTFTATAPVASVYATGALLVTTVDNGVTLTTPGRVTIGAAGTTLTFRSNTASGAWTNSGGKRAVTMFPYEF